MNTKFRIPRVFSKRTLNHKKDITIQIILTSIENFSENRNKNIKKKVYSFEERICPDGYITKIDKILDISNGLQISNRFDMKIIYNVVISCYIFNVDIGDVIVGCKLINKNSSLLTFNYNNINIFISGPYVNYNDYKIGEKYNIQCIGKFFELNKPRYILKYRKSYSTIINKHKKIETMEIKKKKSKDTFINYYNEEVIVKPKNIISIQSNPLIHINGNIFYIYDIPSSLRYLKLPNVMCNNDDILSMNVFVHEDYEYSDFDIKRDDYLYSNSDYLNFVRHLINPYELLYPNFNYMKSNNIIVKNIQSKYGIKTIPISRAYFKIYEIINVFKLNPQKDQIMYTIGDAPGGWAQMLFDAGFKNTIITTSLKNGIKYSTKLNKKIKINYLYDNTGNLLKYPNLIDIIEKYKNKCTYVFSDGALAYDKPNVSKEIQHTKLFLIEVILGIYLCAQKGHSVIKLYKINTNVTMQIMYWAKSFFEEGYIYKPKTIKITNSETMLVLKNRNKKKINHDYVSKILETILKTDNYIEDIFIKHDDINYSFFTLFEEFKTLLFNIEKFTHDYAYEITKIYGRPLNHLSRYLDLQKKYAERLFWDKEK